MRALYAGYRMGAFAALDLPADIPADRFLEAMESLVTLYGDAWIARAPTAHGVLPVIVVFLMLAGPFWIAGDGLRMPWASARNVFEGYLALCDALRRDRRVLFWSRFEDKAFWTQIARYGVIRRVGTLMEHDPPLGAWETRSP